MSRDTATRILLEAFPGSELVERPLVLEVVDLVHQHPGKTRTTIRAVIVGHDRDTIDAAIDRAVEADLIRQHQGRLWPTATTQQGENP